MATVNAEQALASCDLSSALLSIGCHALNEWFPGADFEASRLPSGFSGAALIRLDVRGAVEDDVAGVYVLKLAAGDGAPPEERPGEEKAAEASPGFAERHIPSVVRAWTGKTSDDAAGSARLLHLAGGSMMRYTTGSARGSSSLHTCSGEIASGMLEAWTRPADVVTCSPLQLLEEALGAAHADEALSASDAFFPAPPDVLWRDGHTYLSPSDLLRTRDEPIPLMRAFQHGDLHPGNLLMPVEPGDPADDFWLIDLDRAWDGYLGLDFAYLEMSIVCDFYDDVSASVLARCLEHAEHPSRAVAVPDDMHWLVDVMSSTRRSVDEYGRSLPGRSDDLERQVMLSRIVEGLRWARRHRGRKSKLALHYAGWYAAQFERTFPDTRESTGRASDRPKEIAPEEEALDSDEEQIWDSIWQATGHFARPDWTYVLVSERLAGTPGLGALGKLPWSAVIDLDPRSDDDGLYSQAGPVLASGRSVHVHSGDPPAVADTTRGVTWLLSGGWGLRRESHLDFRQWFRTRFRFVRAVFESLRKRAGEQHFVLVAVLGERAASDAERDEDRVVRVMEAFDEVWGERGTIHVIGEAEPVTTLGHTFYPIRSSAFAQQLAATFGTEEPSVECKIPGRDGEQVVLREETFQLLQEHLEVLHDRVALSTEAQERSNDAFWRGGQILWRDLAEDLDVPREVGSQLERALLDSLESNRSRTLVLEHRPGAGGTTIALRAAWGLRRRYPVAVLRPGKTMGAEVIQLLADRLQRLFVLSGVPVLFVVDSSDLPEAYREALYRELMMRGTRVTTLYVRRSLAPDGSKLSVSDPLTQEEARLFLARYRQLTHDPGRIAELEALGSEAYSSFRSPFFYGLITFQRDFEKLEEYVGHHLRAVAGRARAVLSHMALVSRYTNSGLQLALLQRLFRLKASPKSLSTDDLFGKAAPLVVQRGGRFRIAHQLLAEEILARLAEPATDWKAHLNDLALDLIEDLCAVADTSTDPVRLLFRQMFIDRVSGSTDGVEDRRDFAPIIEELDQIDPSIGHYVLKTLAEQIPDEPHFWNHLGRHQVYRLERDLDLAEGYLEKAIALSPEDAVHHHTLGLARRGRLRQGLRTAEAQGVEAVTAVIDTSFQHTVECFEKSRELSSNDIYGYITHVQTIVEAARALRTSARVENVADLAAVAGDWVIDQLTVANSLLAEAARLYGVLDRRDDYLQQCLADIHHLYGNLDEVVRIWEVRNAGSKATPFSRRALAQAYFVRANRSWRALTETELTRIASLAETNMRGSAREEDYQLWFEAKMLLKGFEVEQALAQLEMWSSRFPSWRAAYYRSILHFLLWFDERSGDTRQFHEAQAECQRLTPGRPRYSHSWLAKNPSWCPLIADSDLGEWDRHGRFWKDTESLQRVNGVIDIINGNAGGTVAIGDGQVQASFVASGNFARNFDENTPVNFFLGFSPAGLTAWDVDRGHSDQALDRRGELVSLPEFVGRPRQADYDDLQRRRAEELRFKYIRELAQALLEARGVHGEGIRLSWLEERVAGAVGLDSLDSVREDALSRAVSMLPAFKVDKSGSEPIIRPRQAGAGESKADLERGEEIGFVSHFDRQGRWGMITGPKGQFRFSFDDVKDQEVVADLRRGLVARYVPSRERRGDRALQVELLSDRATIYDDRLVDEDGLAELVIGEIRRTLEAALAEDRAKVPASELEDHLERTFRGGLPLGARLNVTGLRAFLRQLRWLSVDGRAGSQAVSIQEGAVFGRLRGGGEKVDAGDGRPPPKGKPPAGARKGEEGVSSAEAGDALGNVLDDFDKTGAEPTLQRLGPALKLRLGEEGYAGFTRNRGLRRAIMELGPWMVKMKAPGVFVVSKARAHSTPEARAIVIEDGLTKLRSAGKDLTVMNLGQALSDILGPQEYKTFLGKFGLARRVEQTGHWSVVEERPGMFVIEKRKS